MFNVPLALAKHYSGRKLIVRSGDPAEMVEKLATHDLEKVAYLQILGTGGKIDELMRWEQPIPVDLVLEDPKRELPLLYRYSPLLTSRPVRVSIPVAAGFSKAVKLALSLNFAVKLEPSQPGPELIEELLYVVDLYLHQSTVSQPVEYIHSVFLAFYHGEPVSLWAVQEEDPSRIRFVTDQGGETISRRFAGANLKGDLTNFIRGFTDDLLNGKGECRDCRFLEVCLGYFKWPGKEYRCDGVKGVFEVLDKSARELKEDISSIPSSQGERQP